MVVVGGGGGVQMTGKPSIHPSIYMAQHLRLNHLVLRGVLAFICRVVSYADCRLVYGATISRLANSTPPAINPFLFYIFKRTRK